MYKGYVISEPRGICNFYKSYESYYLTTGRTSNEATKKIIRDKILSGRWVIDGADTESDWFPQVKSHVFISHSHQDEKAALMLAGVLKSKLGIESFVDSAAWGNYEDLAKVIYEKARIRYNYLSYEQSEKLKDSARTHAHCMLTKSLIQMMDRCECLLFLGTPSSMNMSNVSFTAETYSPWIYNEIEASRVLRRYKYPRGLVASNESVVCNAMDEAPSINVRYPLSLNHLIKLDLVDLFAWIATARSKVDMLATQLSNPYKYLDHLYNITLRN